MIEDKGDQSSGRWLAPQDGGRGVEIRRRWSCIRWFSPIYGTAWRRGRHRWWSLTWHFGSRDEVLFGFVSFEDDDGDRNRHVGLWPWHLRIVTSYWPRPTANNGGSDDQS